MAVQIKSDNVGKRFNKEWVFKSFDYVFESGFGYSIIGPNGSGKSTLLQVLSGAFTASEGALECIIDGKIASQEKQYQFFSFAAPYLDLPEEMTATEFLVFHCHFKPFFDGLDIKNILDMVSLSGSAKKQIRYFSSGMKQRLKLAQAIFSNTPILFLDEPCMNLDSSGIDLYQGLIERYTKEKLVIVSSNEEQEYSFCQESIRILDYKN